MLIFFVTACFILMQPPLVPAMDYLPGPLPLLVITSLNATLAELPFTYSEVHYCGGVHLIQGLATDHTNPLHLLGGNHPAMAKISICSICQSQSTALSHLFPPSSPAPVEEVS